MDIQDTTEIEEKNIIFEKYRKSEKSNFSDMDSSLENKVNDQLLGFRRHLKNYLMVLLGAEIFFLMAMITCQGLKLISLNDWFLSIFSNVCLIQTFFLIKWIVSHIFPADPQKMGWMK